MSLPELEKGLLREQLDKHTTFAGTISMVDKIELQDMELEQIAFDAALQHRTNFHTKRQGRVVAEYRARHKFDANGAEEITTQEAITVYKVKFPATALTGKELEATAMAECLAEKDTIDADINASIVGNGNSKLSVEQSNIIAFSNTRIGIRDKLANLKRAVVTANWKA